MKLISFFLACLASHTTGTRTAHGLMTTGQLSRHLAEIKSAVSRVDAALQRSNDSLRTVFAEEPVSGASGYVEAVPKVPALVSQARRRRMELEAGGSIEDCPTVTIGASSARKLDDKTSQTDPFSLASEQELQELRNERDKLREERKAMKDAHRLELTKLLADVAAVKATTGRSTT